MDTFEVLVLLGGKERWVRRSDEQAMDGGVIIYIIKRKEEGFNFIK